MDRRTFSLSLMGAAVLSLTGCGGGDDAPAPAPAPAPAAPELASATSLPAASSFLQSVLATDGGRIAAPDQANYWSIDNSFRITDCNDWQINGALELSVEASSFPGDQTYAELTALGPELGTADGVKYVSFTTDGDFVANDLTSAVLHAVRGAKLQQTVTLPVTTGAIWLEWGGYLSADINRFNGEPFHTQVVIRSTAGEVLKTLYRRDQDVYNTGSWGVGRIDEYNGETVVVSFEYDGPAWPNAMVIDNVTLSAESAPGVGDWTECLTNGDFEAGGTGWTVPDSKVAQNVRSGVRTLAGLEVQRTLFTQPDKLWARMTDEFVNPTASPITASVRYYSEPGAGSTSVIYPTPGAGNRAVSSWDSDGNKRDIGLVHGSLGAPGSSIDYTSDDGLGSGNGSGSIDMYRSITVPAGGRVTVVNFVILNGTATAQTATDINARATEVDTVAAAIANNFRTDVSYQRGMTQDQLDTVVNF
jgi:hypothetical protein